MKVFKLDPFVLVHIERMGIRKLKAHLQCYFLSFSFLPRPPTKTSPCTDILNIKKLIGSWHFIVYFYRLYFRIKSLMQADKKVQLIVVVDSYVLNNFWICMTIFSCIFLIHSVLVPQSWCARSGHWTARTG